MPRFGRPPKLNRADQLLMMLMYWREYRIITHRPGLWDQRINCLSHHPQNQRSSASLEQSSSDRRKRFCLRFNLIAAVYRLGLQAKS